MRSHVELKRVRLTVLAMLLMMIAPPTIGQDKPAALQDKITLAPVLPEELVSRVSARIDESLRKTLTQSVGAPDLVTRLTADIEAGLAGIDRKVCVVILAQIDPKSFDNPDAVTWAIKRVRGKLAGGMVAWAALPVRVLPVPPPAKIDTAPAITEHTKQGDTAVPPDDTKTGDKTPSSTQTLPSIPSARPSVANLKVSYNAPAVIPLGGKTLYRLIIHSAHALTAQDFANAPGPVQGRTLPMLKQVKAVMTGPAGWVDIDTAGSPACQTIGAEDNPTWDWFVTPKTTQAFDLKVEIWEVGPDCNAPAPVVHRIDSFPIKVTATWWQLVVNFAGDWKNAALSVLAVLGAAGGAFGAWKWMGKGKEKTAE